MNSPSSASSSVADQWISLTPLGALSVFSAAEPDASQQALQTLLRADRSLTVAQWLGEQAGGSPELLEQAQQQHWVQLLARPIEAPDTRLADFIQHVIAPLSAERKAVLASESGFNLGQIGVSEEEAETLSAAAADYADFAGRQAQRGFAVAGRYVSFFNDPLMLIPEWSFVPFWVDGNGYWLVLGQEPLLNNQAFVELVWGVCIAAHCFVVPASE